MPMTVPVLGDPQLVRSPNLLGWLSRSRAAAVVWTAARIWLGIQWIQAGKAKLWGAENPAFLHHGGAGVAGYATHGVASYTWWHHLLTGFVVPNSAWIGKVISVSEFTIGVALVLGVLTPLFAVAGLTLNMIYMFSGTAGVNPMFAILSVVLILAWRTSGWIGADGLLMAAWQRRRHATGSTPVTGGADAPPLEPVTDARRPMPTVAPPTLAPS